MMNCKQCQKRMSAYADRELPPEIQRLIAVHLSECKTCQAEYEQMIQTWHLLSLPPADPRPYAYARLKNRMEKTGPVSCTQRWPEGVFVPVVAVIMLMTGAWLGSRVVRTAEPAVLQNDIPESSAMDYLELLNQGSLSDAYADLIVPAGMNAGGER